MANNDMIVTRIVLRNDNSTAWATANSILLKGEIGIEINGVGSQPKMKIGDGVTTWNNLPYFGSGVVVLRRDNDYNYKKVENTLIPAYGEVCLVDVAGYGLRAKVGDGISTFAQLPYTDETILNRIDNLIIKGYYYNGKFYTDSAHTSLLEDKVGRIYIDAINSRLYTYNGVSYETQNGNLPNASAELAGAVKLYNEVGQNVDGTMTQRAITNELNEKFEMDVNKNEEMVIFDVNID